MNKNNPWKKKLISKSKVFIFTFLWGHQKVEIQTYREMISLLKVAFNALYTWIPASWSLLSLCCLSNNNRWFTKEAKVIFKTEARKTKESFDKNVFSFDRDFSVFDRDYQWTDRLCDKNFLQTNEFLVKDFQRKVVVSIVFGIVIDFLWAFEDKNKL